MIIVSMKRVIGTWFLTVAAIVSIVAPSVYAATPAAAANTPDQAFNIVTSPLPINLTGKPGDTLTADIRVKNGGAATEQLKVSLMKFSAYGDEGKPAIADRAAGDDYFDWVSFSPQIFEAPSNEWITVKMTIKLPKTAAFGYYYAPVFSRATAPIPAKGKENALVGSAAVLVLVDVDVPGAKRTGTIDSFTASKRTYEFLPASFTIKVHNSGNVHLMPNGNVFIKQGNKTVATLHILPSQANVLPNSSRKFTATWSDGFPSYVTKQEGGKVILDKNGQPVTSLQWDFSKLSKLRIGKYSAHVLMAYDDGKRDVPLEAVVSFWVMPWRILAVVLLVVLLVGAGIWSMTHNVVKKVRVSRKNK
jgi:hypothetical protein